MKNREHKEILTHHPQINARYNLGNPICEKTHLEGEVALLSFLQM
jgi:hypothetical protein